MYQSHIDEEESALIPSGERDSTWRPILHVSNQVVLYNPTSHALTIHPLKYSTHSPSLKHNKLRRCPYCSQPLPQDDSEDEELDADADYGLDRFEDVSPESRAANYFQLLEIANESVSRPVTPPTATLSSASSRASTPPPSDSANDHRAFPPESMAEGYFKAFFEEEARLGMGANGSVYLCQHVLNGNPLGHFAVKKIAVGQSTSYLLQILREVRLLETLRHPNIITYHHAWLENAQFSSFGPKIPTLHVLMQWAEGGSLDDYIDARLGRDTHLPRPDSPHSPTDSPTLPDEPESFEAPPHSRSARIRAFRALQRAPPSQKSALRAKFGFDTSGSSSAWKAVHLLSAEEVRGVFGGVVAGLGFLHDKSILHLDLKPGNVLLTWDEGTLIPRAMLSDFGTSRDMLHSPRTRSGNTGTLEYTSPESLPVPPNHTLPPTDSKSDMWSLGMILHKLLFFRLPYRWAAHGDRAESDSGLNSRGDGDGSHMDKLEREVSNYPGFKATPELETIFASRRLPRAYIVLLENLLNVLPTARPSCEKVLAAVHLGKLDPLLPPTNRQNVTIPAGNVGPKSSLIPAPRRHSPPLSSPTLPQPQIQTLTRFSPSASSTSRPHVPSAVTDDDDLTPKGETDKPPLDVDSPLLGSLPAISEPPITSWEWWWRGVQRQRIPVIRTIKSVILATKVASITTAPSYPSSSILWGLLVLGIRDTLSDSLWYSVIVGLVHVMVLKACNTWGCSA
ncbi:kinase-like protein [Artomyces pyxidatus]|uniref:Kinase-like protein n=1 Tax=Artomyces pyxidatus TaxID=48021 RepID=A0ACB8T9K9_9AGAM|nr:kinase-like protein [Artomyces pyxidatus]